MSPKRQRLTNLVFRWLSVAIERRDYDRARGLWRVIDALYDDLPIVRTPGFRDRLRKILESMQQSVEVQAVRKELGL